MATDATIRRVARPRGVLARHEIDTQAKLRGRADRAEALYREYVVAVLARGASFSEVSKATGLSTATLQRWKREASS